MKQGWEIKKLGEVCTSDLGKTLNQSRDTGDMHPYLCAINILWDKIDFTTVKQTRFEPSEIDRYSVRKNDLLICEGGDIGRAAIWDKDETMLYQNALHRVRFDGSIIPRFCLLYLRFLKNTGVLDGCYGKGVTIKHLVKSSLLSIPIPVPTLAEQEKIVAELDCISGIIEKKKQQLKELDNLAQSVFYEMFGDPVKNDKGWDIKKFGDVANSELGKMLDSKKNQGELYPYLCSANVQWNDVDCTQVKEMRFEEDELERYRVYKGDLLICEGGDTGRCAIWKSDNAIYYQNALHRVRFVDGLMLPIFCLYTMKCYKEHGEIDKYSSGQTIKHLVKKVLLTIPLIVPPITLQQEFASKIESIEKQKELIAQSIKETETLFNSRMDYYFN